DVGTAEEGRPRADPRRSLRRCPRREGQRSHAGARPERAGQGRPDGGADPGEARGGWRFVTEGRAAGPVTPRALGGSVALEDVKRDREVDAYVTKADEYTRVIGYTEHGVRHANLVASIAGNVLRRLGSDERAIQLAAIAGYLHDIGNLVGRVSHEHTGAILASRILTRLGMDPVEMAIIM